MKELRRNIRMIGVLLVAAFIGLGAMFGYTVYSQGSRWMTTPYNQRLTSARSTVTMGEITDRTGMALAYTDANGQRHYASNRYVRRALSQTVGDALSMSGTGVETFHAGTLLGISGSIIDRAWQWARGDGFKGDDIRLTVDAELSAYISGQFPSSYEGAAVLINYKTGEILAMISKPDYDPSKLDARNIDSEGSAYLNRCTQGLYTPGSVFKITTLSGALSGIAGATTRTFNCEGEHYYGDIPVRCIGGTVHGALSLKDAFAKSCNVTFGALGSELGTNRLVTAAQAMGFNVNFQFRDLIVYNSSMPSDISTESELAWSAVGQGRVQVTPLHMAMIAGSVANGGVMMEPSLIAQVTGSTGIPKLRTPGAVFSQAMSAGTANVIKEYMRATVEEGTARNARVKGLAVCGKTGSAEISDDKNVPTHAWFVGFLDDAEHPYALAVVIEHGGAGSDRPSKLAASIFKKAVELLS